AAVGPPPPGVGPPPPRIGPPPSVPRRSAASPRPACLSALLAALACAGCAGPGTERHFPPLFSEISTAGGGTELEALGGILRGRRTRAGGPLRQWALRPLVIHDREADGDSITHFLTPLGYSQRSGGEYTWQLLPITRYHEREYENGEVEWQLLTLPFIYWS